MDAAFYKEYYYIERNHWWFKARAEILEEVISHLLKLKSDSTILNVGAATGQSSIMLSKFGSIKSLEYDEVCCNITKETLGIDIIQGSILELPYADHSFDLVCCFDVIEHVEEDKKAALELLRVCKPDGYIFITVPAFNFLWSEHDDINQHMRRYTQKSLLPLLNTYAKIIYTSYFNFLLFLPIASFRLISKFFPKRKSETNTGSDNSVSSGYLSNLIFFPLFRVEKYILRNKVRLPFGVSLMAIWQK